MIELIYSFAQSWFLLLFAALGTTVAAKMWNIGFDFLSSNTDFEFSGFQEQLQFCQ